MLKDVGKVEDSICWRSMHKGGFLPCLFSKLVGSEEVFDMKKRDHQNH